MHRSNKKAGRSQRGERIRWICVIPAELRKAAKQRGQLGAITISRESTGDAKLVRVPPVPDKLLPLQASSFRHCFNSEITSATCQRSCCVWDWLFPCWSII